MFSMTLATKTYADASKFGRCELFLKVSIRSVIRRKKSGDNRERENAVIFPGA